MKAEAIIQLVISYEASLYAPPDKWRWAELLELEEGDSVEVSVIEEPHAYSEDDPRRDSNLAKRLGE